MATIGAGWSRYVPLTIPTSKIDADLTDFPLKVILNSTRATISDMQDDGDDIRICKADGTILDFEKEMFLSTKTINRSYDGISDYENFYNCPTDTTMEWEYDVTVDTLPSSGNSAYVFYHEFFDTIGSSYSDIKLRRIGVYIDSDGYIKAILQERNNGDSWEYMTITSLSTISASDRVTIKVKVEQANDKIYLYVDDILQSSDTNPHSQTWSQVSEGGNFLLIGAQMNMYSIDSDDHDTTDGFLDGTIHSHSMTCESGIAVYHVNIPSVSSTSNTEIRVYFKNDSASDGQNATAVWDSDFGFVSHDGGLTDSTSNGNDGTNSGSILNQDENGYYRIFDGSNDKITLPKSLTSPTALTLELQVELDRTSSEYRTEHNNEEPYTSFRFNQGGTANRLQVNLKTSASEHTLASTSDALTDENYIAIKGSENGGASLFVNENERDTASGLGTFDNNLDTEANILGASRVSDKFLPGKIREVRISSCDRSDAWIKATSYSLADDLITYGAEVNLATRPQLVQLLVA